MFARLALAQEGKGVTYLSDRLLADTDGMQAIPDLAISSIPRHVGVFYKKHQALPAAAQRFLAICDRRFAQHTD